MQTALLDTYTNGIVQLDEPIAKSNGNSVNKITKVIAVIVLMAVFSFSQEQESKTRFGGRVAYIFIKNMDGFSAGAVASVPLTNIANISFINFNPELDFVRRTLHIPFMISCGNYPGSCFFIMKNDLTEFILSIPVQIQFVVPLGAIALSFESGIKLDIPLLTNGTLKLKDSLIEEEYTDNRAAFDFGFPLVGFGLIIGKHFTLGFRLGITTIGEKMKHDLSQGELSLMYLF